MELRPCLTDPHLQQASVLSSAIHILFCLKKKKIESSLPPLTKRIGLRTVLRQGWLREVDKNHYCGAALIIPAKTV